MSKKSDFRFLFDEKIILSYIDNYLNLRYRINDWYLFLTFSPETKKFVKCLGFGRDNKISGPYWWKDPRYDWKEMEKEDENQIA